MTKKEKTIKNNYHYTNSINEQRARFRQANYKQ